MMSGARQPFGLPLALSSVCYDLPRPQSNSKIEHKEHPVKISPSSLSIPRPTVADFVAIAIAIAGAVVALASWGLATSKGAGEAFPTSQAIGFALLQLGVCSASLLALGLTAKRGTIIGHLAALAGMMVGISGGLLAAALWTLG